MSGTEQKVKNSSPEERVISKPSRTASKAMSALLSIVFFCSGFAALLYQLVWQRVLTQHYGVGCMSVTMIVCVYMLGLGLGALAGGAMAKKTSKLIGLYFAVELCIALFGFASLPILQALGTVTAGSPLVASFACMFLFLCIPTFLMGTTLPILTEILMRMNSSFLTTVSSLYFFNTLGASIGAFVGVFYLITFFGLDGAVYTAATVNMCLAIAIAACIPRSKIAKAETLTSSIERLERNQAGNWAYLYVLITGFVAIAYEIVWFRTVEILIKASPYAFGTVLAVYLLGIAGGSWMMNRLIAFFPRLNGKRTFFAIQSLIALYGILSYGLFFQLSKGPLRSVIEASFQAEMHPSFASLKHSTRTFADAFAYFDFLIWPAFFMLVPTLLMGASFPLISELARSRTSADAETLGRVYYCNVLGNVAGAVCAGFIFLEVLGTASTVLLLSAMATPFLLLWFFEVKNRLSKAAIAVLSVSVILWAVVKFPSSVQFVEAIHVPPTHESRVFVQEGTDCVVVTYKDGELILHYLNGLAHGGRPQLDPAFQQRAVEALCYAHSNSKVLIIGYGTGAIAEAVLKSPEVQKVTIVELNHSTIANLKKVGLVQKVTSDPRVELVIDDGRRYLNRVNSKYDVVLMDPLRSSTAYSTNIYSKEFFQLVQRRLENGGLLMVWHDNLDVQPLTLSSVFKHARFHKWFCLGSDSVFVSNENRRKMIMAAFPKDVHKRMEESVEYLGDENYIAKSAQGFPITRDLKPNGEYYLAMDRFRRKREKHK